MTKIDGGKTSRCIGLLFRKQRDSRINNNWCIQVIGIDAPICGGETQANTQVRVETFDDSQQTDSGVNPRWFYIMMTMAFINSEPTVFMTHHAPRVSRSPGSTSNSSRPHSMQYSLKLCAISFMRSTVTSVQYSTSTSNFVSFDTNICMLTGFHR